MTLETETPICFEEEEDGEDLLQTEERINIKLPSSNFVGEFSLIILLQKAHDIDVWSDSPIHHH